MRSTNAMEVGLRDPPPDCIVKVSLISKNYGKLKKFVLMHFCYISRTCDNSKHD